MKQNINSDKKRWPKVSIWQGTNDYWARWVNARELMEQWTDVHHIDQQPDVEDVINGYPHKAYKDDQGNTLVETYTITSMNHGLPIDPGPGQEQCGSPADYIFPVGICSSYYIAKFWGLDKK